ncbi:hypothetical protein [Vacuolonema iberomarrocanum]|uniref:hypothetical protein n=1 Tax=Vacuolonema iberomarrocanum TaxID=3454632 RepID=UPI0019DE1084|nr:hypothetical protein [filamentous cyanobacterium LEGE 07170]
MSSLSSHLAHLRNTLPMAVLVTELVSHQEGQFAVRAMISVGNQPIVTSLAAHANIELAEDRARERALQRFADWVPSASGVSVANISTNSMTTLPPPSFTPLETAGTPATQPPGLDADLPPANFSQPTAFAGGNAPSTSTDASTGAIADLYSHISASEPLDDNPVEDASVEDSPLSEPALKTEPPRKKTATSRSAAKKGARKSAEPSPPPPPVQESVDLSDVIAQTDIELRRLSWTNVQGREYLEQTYGKRSRQELSELELYEFLSYLEEQPTPQSAG